MIAFHTFDTKKLSSSLYDMLKLSGSGHICEVAPSMGIVSVTGYSVMQSDGNSFLGQF